MSVDAGGAEQDLVFFIGPPLNVHQDPFLVDLAEALGIDAVVRIESEGEHKPPVVSEDEKSKGDETTHSFWSFDGAE
ncbi:MAG: hypothetical protein ACPIA6_07895 [Poseidonia sp.]